MKNFFYKKIILILVLIGSLNWGLIGSFNFNLVEFITKYDILKNNNIKKIIYIIIGLSALLAITFLFKRDNMLPFLGRTVYPCKSLDVKYPLNYDKVISINVKPNINVIYWGSETGDGEIVSWKKAYNEYRNSGVALSDNKGTVELKFRTPQAYTVPYKGLLKPHIHYRTCDENGMLSRIETIYV